MARPSLRMLYAQIRGLTAGAGEVAPSDGHLLERYLSQRDEEAFAALVHRHGAMVLATCRRVLSCEQDAEDAWQATFLILACRGKSIRKHDHLAGWLHGVACRVAHKLRAAQLRRRTEELPDLPAPEVAPDAGWREVQALLDEELERLPEQYRAPIVLCYLEGQTRDEAARRLGWTLATLRGRLERARERLRYRLTRRGVTLSATLVGAFLATPAGAIDVPATLAVSAVRSAVEVGKGIAPGAIVSGRIVTLMEGVILTMCWTRAKLAAVMILGACLAGLSAGLLAQQPNTVTLPEPIRLPPEAQSGGGRVPPEKAKPLDLAQRVAELEKQVAQLRQQVESLQRGSGKAGATNTALLAIPLKHAHPEEVAKRLKEMLGENREEFSVGFHPRSETLAVKGSPAVLAKVKEIVSKLDVPSKPTEPQNHLERERMKELLNRIEATKPGPEVPVLKTFLLRASRPEDVVRAIQQILKDRDLRVAAISARSILVSAQPADLATIEDLIRRIEDQNAKEIELEKKQPLP